MDAPRIGVSCLPFQYASLRSHLAKSNDSMSVPKIRRRNQFEDRNSKLERLIADLALDRSMLQDVLKRKW